MNYTIPSNLTPEGLYVLYTQIGLNGLFEEGAFFNLQGNSGSARAFTVSLPVLGDSNANFVRGAISYAQFALVEAPLLLGFLSGVSADHAPEVIFYNVTPTTANFIVRQSNVIGGTTLPLSATLIVIAIK